MITIFGCNNLKIIFQLTQFSFKVMYTMCWVNSSHFLLVPIGKRNIPLPNHCDITVWKCRIYKIDLQKILTIDYVFHLDIIAFAILENGQSHFQIAVCMIFLWHFVILKVRAFRWKNNLSDYLIGISQIFCMLFLSSFWK